ncbi:hypothetical protein IAI10_14015 [Clostridium sp. 19966]|uniref:hypothetical protein n=1 Tax=Clostridium sp. 19966 TaxID=2768166 RepID=UPI0028E0218F|nr:hypothetical protein [Clostridium sp. 19966]MDT8717780.1 hypothetical protein [Clostridium sp. 19966]
MKVLKTIILFIISIVTAILGFLIFALLISLIQQLMLEPKEYIMSVYKDPNRNLIFIYEIYFIALSFCIFNKSFRNQMNARLEILMKHKKILGSFIIINLVILYASIFDISVITQDKIIDYRFLAPQGKTYSYNDIVKIDTGIYGRKSSFISSHSKGDFYYVIELKDGNKIDLGDFAGSNSDEDYRFTLERLDKRLVGMNIDKVSSTANLNDCAENLDKVYVDKIKNILENIKK